MKEKRQLATEEKAALKKPSASVFLGYPLYDEVEAAAREEPVRGISAFVMELVRYGWRAYREVGSLKALKALDNSPGAMAVTSKRISAERCDMMAEALKLILERGSLGIIEAVEADLIERAGRFGDPRK